MIGPGLDFVPAGRPVEIAERRRVVNAAATESPAVKLLEVLARPRMHGKYEWHPTAQFRKRLHETAEHDRMIDGRRSMQGDDAVLPPREPKLRENGRTFPDRAALLERVDHDVANEMDLPRVYSLASQVQATALLADEKIRGDRVGQEAVETSGVGSSRSSKDRPAMASS